MAGRGENHLYRKWLGVLFLFIEMNLLGGTIFGFAAIFPLFSRMHIYEHLCPLSGHSCPAQIQQYQNAMTLGIAFFDLPAFFIGIGIDRFGCRFVKLISIIFHLIGWLSLALLQSGRDWLIYIHCIFSSLSGITIVLTSYTSSNYFSKSRAFVSSLLAGSGISATIWFAIFQSLIDRGYCQLNTIAYIWLSFGLMMFLTAFAFLDWNCSFFRLPYQYNLELECTEQDDSSHRRNFWQTLFDPMYILVVLFLSVLLIPTVFLSVLWQPLIEYLTNDDSSLSNRYTFAYNVSTMTSILICPINGYLLGFHADRSRKQKLLNISLVETLSWLLNMSLCVILIFISSKSIVVLLVFNCLCRSTIVAACQSVISTFFPSRYIGRLTGVMWTLVGAFTFIQFALLRLTDQMDEIWKTWLVILSMVLIMFIHLIQIWWKYFKEKSTQFTLTNTRF